jgi:hypothetical protein
MPDMGEAFKNARRDIAPANDAVCINQNAMDAAIFLNEADEVPGFISAITAGCRNITALPGYQVYAVRNLRGIVEFGFAYENHAFISSEMLHCL